jgi:hypothetical protein
MCRRSVAGRCAIRDRAGFRGDVLPRHPTRWVHRLRARATPCEGGTLSQLGEGASPTPSPTFATAYLACSRCTYARRCVDRSRPTGLLHILALLQALVALGLGFASVGGAHVFFTARDRTSKVVAWIGPATLYLVSLIIAVVLLTTFGAASGASVVSVVVFSAVSALWPRKSAPRFLLNWTLQGAAIRYAARSVSTTYVRSVREVRELAEPQSTEGTPTLRDRAAAALRAFRRNSPHSNA